MILDILGSAGFGSVIGGVFGYLTKREERENLKMKLSHDLNMLKAKTDATLQVAKINMEQAKVAGELAVEKLDARAFKESQKSVGKIAEGLKSFVRPVILGLLMYQTFLILSNLKEITGGLDALPVEDVVGLYKVVVLSVTGLTATAVGWYFAARSSKQFDRLIDKWNV